MAISRIWSNFILAYYNLILMLLFWAPQERLNKVITTKLSRFFYFLQANYRRNSNIPRNFCTPIRIDGIRK